MSAIAFHHAPLHTPEQVRQIVREAKTIADELADDTAPWEVVFKAACEMLGQKTSAAVPVGPASLAVPDGFGLR